MTLTGTKNNNRFHKCFYKMTLLGNIHLVSSGELYVNLKELVNGCITCHANIFHLQQAIF